MAAAPVILVFRVQHGEETLVAAAATAEQADRAWYRDLSKCMSDAFPLGAQQEDSARYQRFAMEISYKVRVQKAE